MKFSAKQIAELIGGVIVGDPEALVGNVSKIEEGKPGTISFLSNPKYTKHLYNTEASIVIVNKSFVPEKEVSTTMIQVEDAYVAVAKLMQMYQEMKPRKTGIENPSFISESASIGEFPYIGAFAYIGDNVKIGNNVCIYPNSYIGDNVTIGDNTSIFAGVKIYHDCKVGSNCIMHAGSVIGSDGFGFAPNEDNSYDKIPQLGNVIVEDNCEIGANTTIDRATMGSTFIRKGVKLDNLIQVAHNVEIGEHTVIAALSGIAGSTSIGKRSMIGGHSAIAGHINIVDNTKIGAFTGVTNSIKKEGEIHRGAPSMPIKLFNRSFIHFKHLPDMASDIKELKNEIKKLKEE